MLTIDGYEIDCEVSSEPSYESEVTSHPVEKGADTTDHVRLLPGRLVIEGIVSDSPVGPIRDRRGDVDADGRFAFKPSDDAFAWLLDVRARRQPVTVVTGRRTYKNMILQTLTPHDDATTGRALNFTATFVEMQFVTNARTTVRVAQPRSAKKVVRGNKAAEPSTTPPKLADPEPNDDSWLKRGGDAAIRKFL